MKLFEALGLNWKILLAQLVNFAVLVWVLHKFGYVPIKNFLDKRAEKIESGLKNAETAEKRMAEVAQTEKEIVIVAKKEAQEIIKKAENMAKKNADDIILQAKEESKKIVEDVQKSLEHEKSKMLLEVRSEVAGLVVSATEKLVAKKIDCIQDGELIESSINQL